MRNGLRVLSERVPSVRSISIGVWIDVGSRNEHADETGLSHYIEHLVFKGTKRRNSKEIAASLESIGGVLNAFTSREQTCFTARVLDEYLDEALDVLADITCHATLTQANMNREKQVICEEIKESLDSPMDRIHDLFAEAFWGDHPLGKPILGTYEGIQEMTRGKLMKYVDRNYRAGSIVIAASGSISHAKLLKLVREKFSFATGEVEPFAPANRDNFRKLAIYPADIAQTHFCLGLPGMSFNDPRKMIPMLMASYLGGGMSSVLFQKIREDRGLAYTVYAYHDFFRDSGIFGVYLGTDKKNVRKAYDVTLAELRKMKKKTLSSNNLDQVKAQIKGHLTLGMEGTSNRMSRLGRQEFMLGTYVSLEKTLKAIDKVTPAEIRDVANEYLDESQMSIATLGPIDPKEFDDIA